VYVGHLAQYLHHNRKVIAAYVREYYVGTLRLRYVPEDITDFDDECSDGQRQR